MNCSDQWGCPLNRRGLISISIFGRKLKILTGSSLLDLPNMVKKFFAEFRQTTSSTVGLGPYEYVPVERTGKLALVWQIWPFSRALAAMLFLRKSSISRQIRRCQSCNCSDQWGAPSIVGGKFQFKFLIEN